MVVKRKGLVNLKQTQSSSRRMLKVNEADPSVAYSLRARILAGCSVFKERKATGRPLRTTVSIIPYLSSWRDSNGKS